MVLLAVVGAHLRGQPLHVQLIDLKASFVGTSRTSSDYRLYALETVPPKPGLVRVGDGTGAAIEVELYELDADAFGRFVDVVPSPLCIGKVRLAGGREVAGFLCETVATSAARDITDFGGWRAFLNHDQCS